MKLIGSRTNNKDCGPSRDRTSTSSEYPPLSSLTHCLSRKSYEFENIDALATYDDCLPSLHGYAYKSLETTTLNEKLLEIEKFNSEECKTRDTTHTNREDDKDHYDFDVSVDEMLINNEDDLYKPMTPLVKRLVIKLRGQPRHDDIAQALANFISRQKILQELVLTLPDMSLGDRGVTFILQSLAGLYHLRILYLELRKDKVTIETIKSLGSALKTKTKLVQLGIDLSSNSLTSSMCKELAASLRELINVRFLALNIGGNQIGSDGLREISQLVGELKLLENLVIYSYSNEIENVESINMLIKNISRLGKLRSLCVDLSDNLIGDESANIIASFLKESNINQISMELVKNCVSETTREKLEDEIGQSSRVNFKI